MKVLIAEDDMVFRRLLEATLTKWGYEVHVTQNGIEAWQALQEDDAPLLAILDWMMPGMDGIDVCRKVRQHEQEPYIYLILLTAKGSKQSIIEGLDAGADDYLTKPFDPHELKARLRVGRRILTLQAKLIEAREMLRMQAAVDPLTGVWNRRAILKMLGNELARTTRESAPIAVVIVDLDHFKRINDTYGHMVGDAVLCEAAKRMRTLLRPYDAIGRYGGEEFLIVLPGCATQDAVRLAERLRGIIGDEAMDISEGHVAVTSSLGVATSDAIPVLDSALLIRAADTALYLAKAKGRNRVEVAAFAAITTSGASEEVMLPSQESYRPLNTALSHVAKS